MGTPLGGVGRVRFMTKCPFGMRLTQSPSILNSLVLLRFVSFLANKQSRLMALFLQLITDQLLLLSGKAKT